MQFLSKMQKENLNGKKVLLRVDFNVPVENGKIQENYRILAHKETIDFLLQNGAKVLLLSHHSKDGFSFENIVSQISKILGHNLTFAKDLKSVEFMSKGSAQLYLLDNIRFFPGEEKNDKDFSLSLSKGFDFYINDAFSVLHRNHASIVAITEFLPSYAGFLIEKETDQLSDVIQKPANGKTLIIGGGKARTKVPLVENFLDKAEHILIGGTVANSFFKAQGLEIGKSIFDDHNLDDIKDLVNHSSIMLPEDVIISQSRDGKLEANPFPAGNIDPFHYILDIGPESARHFSDIIKNSKLVIWNGPMGQFEIDSFSEATKEIIKAIQQTDAYTVVGGGDTISAFGKFGDLDKVDFVSTGGGAMLEFLAEKELPGLKVLGYYGK